MPHSGITQWPVRELAEAFDYAALVVLRLLQAKFVDAEIEDAVEVFVCGRFAP